jgi:hypothetical protein
MQQAITVNHRTARPHLSSLKAPLTEPPVIIPLTKPHPVYGKTPIGRDGFTLERQPIRLLNFWHQRATEASAAMRGGELEGNLEYDLLYNCKWDIVDAAFKAKVNGSSDVAALVEIAARQASDCDDVGAIISLARFKYIAERLSEVTRLLQPKKKTGALNRGRKLTRFGLVHRYHAFLIQELETIGWHVYGERDYPMMSRPIDDAVNKKCATPDARERYPIFFNPAELVGRATRVLKSLRIDTVNASSRSRRGGSR